MKRIISETPTQAGPFPSTRFVPAHTQAPVSSEIQAGKTKAEAYMPADVLARTLTLATDRERQAGKYDVRLGKPAPQVYELRMERTSLFHLPEDVTKEIILRLDSKPLGTIAATCRTAYFQVDTLQPGRRLPGLLNDLQRLKVQNFKIVRASFKAFLEAIASRSE
jgi:hypothetical protein